MVEPEQSDAASENGVKTRVFICYDRDDEKIALKIHDALKNHHDVFIDLDMPIGTNWAKTINEELHKADYLIVLLSSSSVHSEMVRGEFEIAYRLSKEHGRPVILPVRLAYREPLPYPLNGYLDYINCAFWDDPENTQRLIEELMRSISAGNNTIGEEKGEIETPENREPDIPQPSPSAQVENFKGAIGTDSNFYLIRQSDIITLEEIKERGGIITIKAPRQMGKSSLLIRIIDAVRKEGEKEVVFLDFQLFDQSTLKDADRFFQAFCILLTDELGIENRVKDNWNVGLDNTNNCTRYMSKYILKELPKPLVLAMDEVESIIGTDFSSNFFAMLRSWHNNRARLPLIWKQLDIVMVISTEPYLLIKNLKQSPFNVGTPIELEDFTLEQVKDLNNRHGALLNSNEETELMNLLNGHPYLTRNALFLIAKDRYSTAELLNIDIAAADNGPFNDHLRSLLFRLQNDENLIGGFVESIEKNTCSNIDIRDRLKSAGLVRIINKDRKTLVVPRCRLYAEYFGRHFNVDPHEPINGDKE